MAGPAKNMLNTAGRAKAVRLSRPIVGRDCPSLISAGRFTMSLRPGASAAKVNPGTPPATNHTANQPANQPPQATPLTALARSSATTDSQLIAGHAEHRSISSVVWVLECFTQGQMDLRIENGPMQRVGPGWATLYSPNTHYYEYALPQQACHSVVIYFDPGEGDILKRLKNLEPSHRFIHDPQQQLTQLSERIVRQLYGQDAEQLAAMSDFLQAMSLLCECADDGQKLAIGKTVEDDLVTRIQLFMRQHLHDAIGVADMARHSSMSESGFAHAYRRLAGASPMNDLRRFRVEAVKMQLLHNRLTLAQIADITGFSDAFHLSHAFRKVAGISPRQFKQQAAAASTRPRQAL